MKFHIPTIFKKFRRPTLDTTVWTALSIAVFLAIALMVWLFRGPSITIINRPPSAPASPLTGLPCAQPTRRPIAVMLGSDPEARPLSGLTSADMVFEMPVTPDGITRMMAVYQCGAKPSEIGSIRSARQDFIPLAQGLKAILAHWGGEHDALEQLNAHVIDNVDALLFDGTVFYRKKTAPRPFNGFTTLDLLRDKAGDFGYAASTSLTGYSHESERPALNVASAADYIAISWPQSMGVEYHYDLITRTYARWRGGTPEMDAVTNQQVHASVVIVMTTDASFLREQYIHVRTLGEGAATIYQDGRQLAAHWSKAGPNDMLTFTDDAGKAIPLAPGQIWVEIDAPLPSVL